VTPGRFIVLEGGEGAGKSTQIGLLVDALRAGGSPVTVTREPGGTAIGEGIRDLLLDPRMGGMDPRTEALLYAADRAQHVAEVIRPALEAGGLVVCDRYVDSSLAYQGLARGLGLERILDISTWATGGLMPDLAVYLDVTPEVGFTRMDRSRDRMESEAPGFHERVRSAYLQIAERSPERFEVVDATGGPSDVHARVMGVLAARGLLGEG
jgi:dTMP kinase